MFSHLPSLSSRIGCGLMLIVPVTLLQCSKENDTGAPPLPTSATNNKSYAEVLAESNDLTQPEETELIKKANSGDAPSAFQLSRFYSSTKKWNLEAIRWLVVSAENGNDVAAFNLGLYYQLPQPTANFERSRHWLKIAEERGNPQAKVELGRLEELLKEPALPPEANNEAPSSEAPPPGK